jgi:hypothetical protein
LEFARRAKLPGKGREKAGKMEKAGKGLKTARGAGLMVPAVNTRHAGKRPVKGREKAGKGKRS